MKLENGRKNTALWMLGDSEPKNWSEKLDHPFDARHPAIHNIWTPVLDTMQDCFYRKKKKRLDTSCFYVRNAVTDVMYKPDQKTLVWEKETMEFVKEYQNLVFQYHPVFLFTFGAFAYEFARRSLQKKPRPYGYWSTAFLGEEFRNSIFLFQKQYVNLIPLLHVSIARGNFLNAHAYFVSGKTQNNYFDYTGRALASLFLRELEEEAIWI